MDDEKREELVERLSRRLRLDDPDPDMMLLLYDTCNAAEEELKLYLNREELPPNCLHTLVELAALIWQSQTVDRPLLKSVSYSEGDVSQTVSQLTPQEVQAAKAALLNSVAHYRRRATWR